MAGTRRSASSIDINGKFLNGPLNGVHRTAAHFADLLMRSDVAGRGKRLLTPHDIAHPHPEFPDLCTHVAKGRFGSGQGWEMLTLPRLARGNLLVNFCNLAPLAHSNSVVMIHDAQTFLYPEDYRGRQAIAYRTILPWVGRRARTILTVSNFSRESLVANGIGHPDKIDVVYNGTDHLLATPADGGILSRFGLQAGGYVLAVGSTKGYKNLRTIFDAMRTALPGGQRLVVAGGPDPQRYRDKGWSPPADCVFTGFVSDAELRALYEGAGVFAFSSLTEGFGLPPVEAMHCGAPVVAAAAGAMPEVCADAAIVVPATSAAAFRKAIEAVFEQPETAGKLRHDGRKRAAQLTWEKAGTRLAEIIAKLY